MLQVTMLGNKFWNKIVDIFTLVQEYPSGSSRRKSSTPSYASGGGGGEIGPPSSIHHRRPIQTDATNF
jgi:hypothetical protein